MNQIKAIDTSYKGFLFRSRLEARWAVFFDALGLDWEYESEGFELPDGTRYLPDFCVRTPQGNPIWYEIKPERVTSDMKHASFKSALYAAEEKSRLGYTDEAGPQPRSALLCGDPARVLIEQATPLCPRCGLIDHEVRAIMGDLLIFPTGITRDIDTYCESCDWETPCGAGNDQQNGVLGVSVTPYKGSLITPGDDYRKLVTAIAKAANAARAARFEWGDRKPQWAQPA